MNVWTEESSVKGGVLKGQQNPGGRDIGT